MNERKPLSEILGNNAPDSDLESLWNATEAAEEFAALPPGKYLCHLIAGELSQSGRSRTPGYKLTFKVIEGPHTNRRVWHDIWLTDRAMSLAKRDLGKLGITTLKQLQQPIPRWLRCEVTVTLERDDDGAARNRVRTFQVLGKDTPEADPFAPAAEG